jgi:hypothetical protein
MQRVPVFRNNRRIAWYLLWTMAPTVTSFRQVKDRDSPPQEGLKAKCAENQANLEILVEKKEKPDLLTSLISLLKRNRVSTKVERARDYLQRGLHWPMSAWRLHP